MREILKTLPLFSRLPQELLMPMMAERRLTLKRYSKGAAVYHQKENCRTFDVVLSGSLVAYALLESGSAMTIFEFTKGQMLGANLLFGDDNTYPFTIYCMSDAQLLHVGREAVAAFLHNYDFALQFVRMLSQNAQKLNRRVTMATGKTLRENLLEYLRQQSILQGSDTLTLPISKKQLADYLGVQRPSLFRALKNLRDEGVIEVSNRKVSLRGLPDPD